MQAGKKAPRLWQKGKGSHPMRRKLERIFPSTRAALRRLKMICVGYPFGNKLAKIVCIGEPEAESSLLLLELGILSHSLLTVDCCALAGFRLIGEPDGRWRLPKTLKSSMCDIKEGGVGKLTFYGENLALGRPNEHTLKVGDFRSEFFSEKILVSGLEGFPHKNKIFYTKKLNNF